MSGATTRMPSSEAGPVARRFLSLIEGCTDQVYVAGSLRRRLPTVGDVEVVAVPTVLQRPTGLFLDVTEPHDLLAEAMDRMLSERIIEKRPRADGKQFWGPKAKYLTFDGVPIDLFTPETERLGIILMIRTGPWGYSRRMVTPTDQTTVVGYRPGGKPILGKGLMPKHMRVAEGWLTYRTSGQKIPTPTEQSVYDLYGLPYAEPWSRQ